MPGCGMLFGGLAMRTSNHCVGIDPGLDGAIAVLDGQGELSCLWDTPLTGGRKRGIDDGALLAIFRSCRAVGAVAILEKVHAMPGEAPQSSFRFGDGYGSISMALASCDIQTLEVAPSKWKGDLGLPGKKNAGYTATEAKRMACNEAMRVVPNVSRDTVFGPRGGPKDGRAEAILLAYWGWSRTLDGMRILAKRWGKGSIEAQAFVLSAGRRGRRVRRGGPLPW